MTTTSSIKVLLLQYSLSGETAIATDEFLQGFQSYYDDDGMQKDVKITKQLIQIQPSFKFPWTFWNFFDIMPETILFSTTTNPTAAATAAATNFQQRFSVALSNPSFSMDLPEEKKEKEFDLLVLGWQTWYLSPSLPIQVALQDSKIQKLINKCKSIVLIGTHRNMWHHASTTLLDSIQNDTTNNVPVVIGQINFVQSSSFLTSVHETLQRQLQGKSNVAATSAKKQAKEEGQKFAQYFNDQQNQQTKSSLTISSTSSMYHGGTLWNPTLAFCEETFFPIKKLAAQCMNYFAPSSLGRKIVTLLYIPILLSSIICLVPPILLMANFKTKIGWNIENKKKES